MTTHDPTGALFVVSVRDSVNPARDGADTTQTWTASLAGGRRTIALAPAA
jgi:hypothetical protein